MGRGSPRGRFSRIMRRMNPASSAVLGALIWVLPGAVADAQQYPARPIRLVVPFAPGGALDVVGRIIGHKLSEALGQPLVVDNRGGAGGTIGADIVAKALADGHTLLVASMGLAVNAVLYPKLPYDTLKDLAPVTMLGEQPNIVVVHPSLPVKSIGELLALTRAKPGQIS